MLVMFISFLLLFLKQNFVKKQKIIARLHNFIDQRPSRKEITVEIEVASYFLCK